VTQSLMVGLCGAVVGHAAGALLTGRKA